MQVSSTSLAEQELRVVTIVHAILKGMPFQEHTMLSTHYFAVQLLQEHISVLSFQLPHMWLCPSHILDGSGLTP